jgi:hypothetical protein
MLQKLQILMPTERTQAVGTDHCYTHELCRAVQCNEGDI